MAKPENFYEACTKKNDVEIAYAKCLQAYNNYYEFVDDVEAEMKSEALNDCQSVMRGKEDFDERFDEWIESIQTGAAEESKEISDDLNPELGFITVDNLPDDSSSRRTRSSRTSLWTIERG